MGYRAYNAAALLHPLDKPPYHYPWEQVYHAELANVTVATEPMLSHTESDIKVTTPQR